MSDGKIARGGLYHRLNPPLSVDAGRKRLTDIDRVIQEITIKLETRTQPSDLARQENYQLWLRRCTTALSYFRSERDFLTGWVRDPLGVLRQHKPENDGAATLFIEQQIADRLKCEDLRYETLFSRKTPGTNLTDMQVRREFLKDLILKLDAAEVEMNRLALSRGLDEREWSFQRQPLDTLRKNIQREQRYISDLVRVGPKLKPVRFLLQMLDQAIADGFELSAEDKIKLAAVKAAQAELAIQPQQ